MNIETFRTNKVGNSQIASTRDKRVIRLRCYLVLLISDVISIVVSFVAANQLVNIQAPTQIEHGFIMLGAILPLFMIQAGTNGTYGAATLDNPRLGSHRSARALLISGAIILLIAYMLKSSASFSRGVFVIGFLGSFVLLILSRRILQPMISNMLGGSAHTTIIICDSVDYSPQSHEIVISSADLGFDPSTNDPRAYHRLYERIAHADRMIVACEADRAPIWAPVLRNLSVDGEILTDVHDQIGAINMRRLGDRSTFVINYGPMTLSARIAKRAFDLIFSLAALFILFPLFIIIAIIIRLESPGPVFFRQERIGCDNRIFRIFKFRSMYNHQSDEHGAKLTQINDVRVTKSGDFIRRTSIDELPQLLNVLKGEMSIVGPRPHALSAKAANILYWDVDTRYRQRHVIKPGMTGLAQVRGFRGNTHHVEDLTNRLQADLEYVANWSLSNDLRIILQTVKVIRHTNAY
ncbi:sugar transferase [Sphingomonas sanguinis]|jgi:exopolysaccharide biosynthesis polyprenyl glycosylphosphotransferase|uniref:sugar transferase n=1 Tax=Sphingomonas sp. LC-1 TaxID=3110957 RepID=UPI0021BBADE1|nr:sugar transferase [Sphingomonas sp. LC-1]MCT8003887.1 sugar transferase [Sphingomonas sp. LC-1]